jgi:hypothetical protein
MGLRPKDLIAAAAEAGIKISSKRASEIISGVAFIKPIEMEIIAKLTNKSVDDLYMELGSVLAAICPLLSAGGKEFVVCCRQGCAWWDWEMQWCTVKNYSPNPAERS